MSVIIKGAKMPSDCFSCCCADVKNEDVLVCRLMNRKMISDDVMMCRHEDCPLVEIPSPHGRIIDERELFKQAPGKITHHHERGFDWEIRNANQWLRDNVPTILDAKGE